MAGKLQEIDAVRQLVSLEVRNDRAGSGEFGAPRGGGKRVHKGIDYVCFPGMPVYAPSAGTITKHGICYHDDFSYKYVEIKDSQGLRHRVFYCKPLPPIGTYIDADAIIGLAQDITKRYPNSGMTPHLHYEVLAPSGDAVDPSAIEVARS